MIFLKIMEQVPELQALLAAALERTPDHPGLSLRPGGGGGGGGGAARGGGGGAGAGGGRGGAGAPPPRGALKGQDI